MYSKLLYVNIFFMLYVMLVFVIKINCQLVLYCTDLLLKSALLVVFQVKAFGYSFRDIHKDLLEYV